MNNLYIKSLCLSTLFTGAYTMQPNPIDDIDSPAEIARHVYKMLEHCSQSCSLAKDITSACTRTCIEGTSKRTEDFLIRKYTASCQNTSFNEIFNFTPTIKDESEELSKTIQAYQARRASKALNECINIKMDEYATNLLSLQKEANSKLDTIKKEDPVITAAVGALHTIRRLGKLPTADPEDKQGTTIKVKIPVKK